MTEDQTIDRELIGYRMVPSLVWPLLRDGRFNCLLLGFVVSVFWGTERFNSDHQSLTTKTVVNHKDRSRPYCDK